MSRTPASHGNAVAAVTAICRGASSAWEAVCTLLNRTPSQGRVGSPGSLDRGQREDAAALSGAMERQLMDQGEGSARAATTYRSAEVADALSAALASETPLPEGALAHAAASALDRLYWPSFTRDWLAKRGTSFELSAGDLYPVGDMRLMGSVGHSARPHRLPLRPGELAHVRRRATDGTRVRVVGEYAPIIDRLASSPPLEAAVLLPNESLAELSLPPNRMGPGDSQVQRSTIDRLLGEALEEGVDIVILPELSVDEGIVDWLSERWAGSADLPILFAGSAHLIEDGRRINRTTILLPGVGVAWHHDKFTVFEGRDGQQEPIDPAEPCITLGCGHLVRVATLVCKDALSIDFAGLVADLGAHLLTVPSMSSTLGEFSTAANLLIARSQGATVVANNPRVWDGTSVGHALLGQPAPQTDRRCLERRSIAAPDLAIARLGSGWS